MKKPITNWLSAIPLRGAWLVALVAAIGGMLLLLAPLTSMRILPPQTAASPSSTPRRPCLANAECPVTIKFSGNAWSVQRCAA